MSADPKDRVLSDQELATLFEENFIPLIGPASDDPSDAMHRHFEAAGLVDWISCYKEGKRVWSLVTGDELEDWSPIDCLLGAIAGESARLAYATVARALGVATEDLECLEDDPDFPAGAGAEALMKWIAENAAERLK